MGWSSSEDFICIQEDGNILVYSLFGQLKDTVHCLSGVVRLHSIIEILSNDYCQD